MFPHINIFGVILNSYAVLGLVGFFAAVLVSGIRAKRYGTDRSEPLLIGVFAGFGLILGAVLLYSIIQIPSMVENRQYLFTEFAWFIRRHFGGLVFYGGLFGAIAGIFIYCKIRKKTFQFAVALVLPTFPLAHSIMRIGCFSAGCCYGIAHPPPFGIAFAQSIGAPNNVYLLPVQLYESGINLIIFLILWLYTKKERHWIKIVSLYGILYSIARFLLEFLRGDEARGFIQEFSTSQYISVFLFLVCILLLSTSTEKKFVK